MVLKLRRHRAAGPSYTAFIARRYLRSRRNAGFFSFIAAIATLGVMLGTAALIITLSVLGGFEREITEKVVGFTSHVQVMGFQNQPLRRYMESERLIEKAFKSVQSVGPYVAREALIRAGDIVDGILLKGLDPSNDVTSTRKYIIRGAYDLEREQGETPKIVLGLKLASKLKVDLGSKVVVFGIGRLPEEGRPRVMQFQVVGIYESGMSEYDDVYAFTDLEDAQALFQLGDAVSGFDIMLSTVDSAEVVANGVQDLLGYPHYGRTVFETYRNLFSWIELQKKPIPIVLSLIIVVATVNIIGTLLMMVLDKTREVGVLASMGATRRDITRIFLRQGMTIGITGTILGNIVAFTVCFAQLQFKFFSLPSDIYFMTSVPILLRPEYFLLVSAISLALCLVSSFIPARLASRMHPVNAIRFA